MRVSTAALHQQGANNILRNQAELARTQNELALGTRLITAKDDPGSWARAAGLDQQLAQVQQYRDNAGIATNRLGLEENALVSVNDTLNRVRELLLQANNSTLSADARKALGDEIAAAVPDLLGWANMSDGQGRYIFAGTDDAAAPFALAAGGGVNYSGNSSQRPVAISPERSVALGDPGDAVFMGLRTGNGTFAVAADSANTGDAWLDSAKLIDASSWDGDSYTLSYSGGSYQVLDSASNVVSSGSYEAGTAIQFRGVSLTLTGTPADGDSFSVTPSQTQDMFALIQKVAALVQNVPADTASSVQQHTQFFDAIQEIDGALSRISEVRSTIGFRLHAADLAAEQLDAVDVQGQTTLSELRDLDYAEATTRFNIQLTALQAAQQSYQRVQGMSLFDYLR